MLAFANFKTMPKRGCTNAPTEYFITKPDAGVSPLETNLTNMFGPVDVKTDARNE